MAQQTITFDAAAVSQDGRHVIGTTEDGQAITVIVGDTHQDILNQRERKRVAEWAAHKWLSAAVDCTRPKHEVCHYVPKHKRVKYWRDLQSKRREAATIFRKLTGHDVPEISNETFVFERTDHAKHYAPSMRHRTNMGRMLAYRNDVLLGLQQIIKAM